jgi:hypothetical protein
MNYQLLPEDKSSDRENLRAARIKNKNKKES